jgi:hypothetical protein
VEETKMISLSVDADDQNGTILVEPMATKTYSFLIYCAVAVAVVVASAASVSGEEYRSMKTTPRSFSLC